MAYTVMACFPDVWPQAFMGLSLWDIDLLPELAVQHGAQHEPSAQQLGMGNRSYPISTLMARPVWRSIAPGEILVHGSILAVARGRQEIGPRALGHRRTPESRPAV